MPWPCLPGNLALPDAMDGWVETDDELFKPTNHPPPVAGLAWQAHAAAAGARSAARTGSTRVVAVLVLCCVRSRPSIVPKNGSWGPHRSGRPEVRHIDLLYQSVRPGPHAEAPFLFRRWNLLRKSETQACCWSQVFFIPSRRCVHHQKRSAASRRTPRG